MDSTCILIGQQVCSYTYSAMKHENDVSGMAGCVQVSWKKYNYTNELHIKSFSLLIRKLIIL